MKRYLNPGDVIRLRLPYSEVCMHMRVAGTVMEVELTASGSAQLWKDREKFSSPVLPGEAGIYRNSNGYYAYPAES